MTAGTFLSDGLPTKVKDRIDIQIVRYFGTNDLRGIPLLDGQTNWLSIANWPDEITLGDKSYQLQVRQSFGDYARVVADRRRWSEIDKLFGYYVEPGRQISITQEVGLSFSGNSTNVWRIDVRRRERTVFGCEFYWDGSLFSFSYDDPDTKRSNLEFFSPDGELIGGILPDKKGEYKNLWQGRNMLSESYLRTKAYEYKVSEYQKANPGQGP